MEGGEETVHASRKVSLEAALHWPGLTVDQQNCHSSRLEILLIDCPQRAEPTECVCVWESIEFLYRFLHLKRGQAAPWCHFNTPSRPGAAVLLQTHCASTSRQAVISFLRWGDQEPWNPESDALCHDWNTFTALFSSFFNILEETCIFICSAGKHLDGGWI